MPAHLDNERQEMARRLAQHPPYEPKRKWGPFDIEELSEDMDSVYITFTQGSRIVIEKRSLW